MTRIARYGRQVGLDIWSGLEAGLRRIGESPLALSVLLSAAVFLWMLAH